MAKTQWFGDKVLSKLDKKLLTRMKGATTFVNSEAKRRCPVDFGQLRSSISDQAIIKDGEVIGQIGTDVEYAFWIEFGQESWKKIKLTPRGQGTIPFLRPALLENTKKIKKFLLR